MNFGLLILRTSNESTNSLVNKLIEAGRMVHCTLSNNERLRTY